MIYLDNAATTQPYLQVVITMDKYLREEYGNPSTLYRLGQSSREAVEKARKTIADSIGAEPEEIYFTSGGSEADNWAIKGVMNYWKDCSSRHMITTKIEHPAVMNTCGFLEESGFNVTYLDVDNLGRVNDDNLFDTIDEYNTDFASIMLANNEIGTIQDIQKLSDVCKKTGVVLHVDAVQAYGQVPINVKEMGIDLLSASAHKIHGPKGIGFLYMRKGIGITPLIHGGHQENGLRAGTENVPAIAGFGTAVELTMLHMDDNIKRMTKIRDHIINRVLNEIPRTRLNGDPKNRLPNNMSFTIDGVEGESLLILMDMDGVCISSGSACMSGQAEPSYVLKAIGLSDEAAKSTIRVTIDEFTKIEEADKFVNLLIRRVSDLRRGEKE